MGIVRLAVPLGGALLLAWCGAVAAFAEPSLGDKVQYRIDARSADSWAHYYQRIGLGTVHQGPLSAADWQALTAHCEGLEDITGHIWIPLGYSIQRGYKLCFRPGPFLRAEAKVFCARLLMEVREQTDHLIVCERVWDGIREEDVNPFLRGM
jgi:hypothetical protein